MHSPSITYIIPYRDQQGRRRNLQRALQWLRSVKAKVIVVEEDEEERVFDLPKEVSKIFIYSPRPFNRSWACNVAAMEAETEYLAFADVDVIMDAEAFNNAVSLLDRFEAISPYKKVIDLTEEESNSTDLEKNRPDREGRPFTNLAGGTLLITKDAFFKIGGWCEEFEGWGGEDDFMSYKIECLLSYKELEGTAYHLWHPRGEPDTRQYDKNLAILNRVNNFEPDILANWILYSSMYIGRKDRYQNMADLSDTAIITCQPFNGKMKENILAMNPGMLICQNDMKKSLTDIIDNRTELEKLVFLQDGCSFLQEQWEYAYALSKETEVPVMLYDGDIIVPSPEYEGRNIPLGKQVISDRVWGGFFIQTHRVTDSLISAWQTNNVVAIKKCLQHSESVPGPCFMSEMFYNLSN